MESHLADRLSAGSPLGLARRLEQGWAARLDEGAADLRALDALRAYEAEIVGAAAAARVTAAPGGRDEPARRLKSTRRRPI
jgi:hypothetical protein